MYKFKDKEWLSKKLEKYGSGSSLAKNEGLAVTSVNRYIRKFGLQDERNISKSLRTHTLNDRFFQEIDSEEKAYVLGFLTADGCISHTHNSYDISFTLSIQDIDILEKIKKLFGSSVPIRMQKESKIINFKVSSKTMFRDLENLGVRQRKTGREHFPNIPQELKKHFIRGYFDGDGSFVQDLNNYIKGGVFICSASEEFLWKICEYFKEEIDLEIWVNRPPSQTIYSIRTNAYAKSQVFYKHIYSDPAISLNRKREKIHNFLNSPSAK